MWPEVWGPAFSGHCGALDTESSGKGGEEAPTQPSTSQRRHGLWACRGPAVSHVGRREGPSGAHEGAACGEAEPTAIALHASGGWGTGGWPRAGTQGWGPFLPRRGAALGGG